MNYKYHAARVVAVSLLEFTDEAQKHDETKHKDTKHNETKKDETKHETKHNQGLTSFLLAVNKKETADEKTSANHIFPVIFSLR